MIGDDLGFKAQTLVSPVDLREFVLPWHKRLARIIDDNGKPCTLHSCGNLAAIMGDLIDDGGIDAEYVPVENYLTMIDQAWKRRL